MTDCPDCAELERSLKRAREIYRIQRALIGELADALQGWADSKDDRVLDDLMNRAREASK